MLCIEECNIAAYLLTCSFNNWKLFLQARRIYNVLLIQHVDLYSQTQCINRENKVAECGLISDPPCYALHKMGVDPLGLSYYSCVCGTNSVKVFIWLIRENFVHYMLCQNSVIHSYVIFSTAKIPMLDTSTTLENIAKIIMMIGHEMR